MPYVKLRKRYQALPLRLKLTLANTIVFLMLTMASLIGVREGLRFMLNKELEVSLRDEAFEIALNAHRPYAKPEGIFDEMANTSAGHLRHGWFLQLFNQDGSQCLWSSNNTPEMFIDRQITISEGLSLQHMGNYAFTRLRLDKPGLPIYWIRLGTSMEFIDEDVENVTRIILPILAVLFLLAPLGGYILAARATAPLKKIILTTEQLRPKQLDERLVIRGTRDELDQLSEKINHFLDEIADHLDRNRQFVDNAAHELRSPLAAIQSAIDVALGSPRSETEYQDLLSTVQEECRQLSVLVNQLLLLAESDAGCLTATLQEVPFDSILNSCLDMFTGVAEEKGITLQSRIQPNLIVRAEASRLRQVANNLIDNAIKFTPAGGKIYVEMKYIPDQKVVKVDITDSGIGIPQDCLPRLFDRFYQVDSSRYHEKVQHGTGLGLSICKSIVEAYGGEISVQSKFRHGTTFTLKIPGTVAKKNLTCQMEQSKDALALGRDLM